MSILKDTLHELLDEFGSEAELYKHDGYTDDFWQEDEGWEDVGTTIKILSSSVISSVSHTNSGFMNDIEADFWTTTEVTEGDLINDGKEWLVTDVETVRLVDRVTFYGVTTNEIEP